MDIQDKVDSIISDPAGYPFNQSPYCLNSVVDSLCILRNCNRRYHSLRGAQPDKSTPPELATAQIKNQVGFLAKCRYTPGHYNDGRVVCLPLRECSGLENLLSLRAASIERMIGGHSAWYDRFFVTYCKAGDGLWRDKSEEVSV